ncbi:Hypothetical_protein [Hexamita inflata]|uniref:Hypothetical_protein n=1 Tax=Hexamita inflata TaxID=28002 RepID=A0AA86Q8D1_9EUKA|nr:Hypothetical protein HINF_LOCUS40121 [Hexamita inflata]
MFVQIPDPLDMVPAPLDMGVCAGGGLVHNDDDDELCLGVHHGPRDADTVLPPQSSWIFLFFQLFRFIISNMILQHDSLRIRIDYQVINSGNNKENRRKVMFTQLYTQIVILMCHLSATHLKLKQFK